MRTVRRDFPGNRRFHSRPSSLPTNPSPPPLTQRSNQYGIRLRVSTLLASSTTRWLTSLIDLGLAQLFSLAPAPSSSSSIPPTGASQSLYLASHRKYTWYLCSLGSGYSCIYISNSSAPSFLDTHPRLPASTSHYRHMDFPRHLFHPSTL